MKVIRVLSSKFGPGGLKKTIWSLIALSVCEWTIGKLTGNIILMWVGPISILLSFVLILYFIYQALDEKERKDYDCEDYLR